VIGADGCTCAGTPIQGGGCTASFEAVGNDIVVSGLTSPNLSVTIFDNIWGTIFNCFEDCDTPVQTVTVAPGTYFVKVQMWDANFTSICVFEDFLTVGGTSPAIVAQNELLFFNAHKADRAVLLNWVINTEYKSSHFVVERSIDGIDFTTLTEETASGELIYQPVNYQLMDENPVLGRNFYRIKQVFADGTYRYTEVKEIFFDVDLNAFVLYPNPTDDRVFVNLREFVGRSANIQIYNALGVLMDRQIIDELNNDPIEFDVVQYPSGQYIITVKVEDLKLMSKQFVKGRR